MMECHIAQTTGPNWKENNPDTDSSLNRSQGPQQQQLVSALLSKKRIGPYSYKLNEVIGSGFSSVVYRGYKDNDKSQVVAIKVVQLHGMRSHRRLLLEKEIKILKMVEHPNILAFKDLYWTINNCYIITEYCQGGNLQRILQQQYNFDWRQAAYEVSVACQYLASLNIIHRDIKPANVLLKNGTFKLSDFGFSLICDSPQPIKEGYLIGSPLYMPIESLSDHLYSTKSDSFALGVLLYYLTSRRFPWKGKSKEELVCNYELKKCNRHGIAHLAPRVKHLIQSLLEVQAQKRPTLNQCDFSVFLHLGPPRSVDVQLQRLKDCFSEQFILCQFINSLRTNAIYFEWANQYLLQFMTRHLASLILIFKWHQRPDLNQTQKIYGLEVESKFTSDDYFWINNCLKDTIRVLGADTEELALVMMQHLLRYQQIIEAMIFEPHQEVLNRIHQINPNINYALATPNHNYIGCILSRLDFYQL